MRSPLGLRARTSFPLILACLYLLVLWLAGGASRADALGQVVVRAASWTMLIVVALAQPRATLDSARPIALLIGASILLALLQLVPLPPELWQALPGRALFAQAADLSGQPQPWRPLAIVPGAAINAAGSLVVPVAMLVLLIGLEPQERPRLVGIMLGLVVASTLVGLLQFSGAGFDNLLINDTVGEVSGTFANRNHFALFVAVGCLLAPVWAFVEDRRPGWRAPVSVGLILLFTLTILASGSRAGMAIGILALGTGLLLVQQGIRRTLRRYPRWVFPALIAAIVIAIGVLVLISIAADRAISIQRAIAVDAEQDMRSRGLPTVLAMVREYWPWGSGLGGFDPLFRINEPFGLLKPTYFNHAHNDLIEVVLDAGLPGLLLLVAALVWWAAASVRAWRAGAGVHHALPKLGSAILLFVILASAFDYPARTPLMMATIVIAAMWLSESGSRGSRALPRNGQYL